MWVSVCSSFDSRFECLGDHIQLITLDLCVLDGLFWRDLHVCSFRVCPWASPSPLTGGEDAVDLQPEGKRVSMFVICKTSWKEMSQKKRQSWSQRNASKAPQELPFSLRHSMPAP